MSKVAGDTVVLMRGITVRGGVIQRRALNPEEQGRH